MRQGGGAVGDPAALAPLVQTVEQAARLAADLQRSRIAALGASLCVPLFATSSVTGASLDLLHAFLFAMQPGSGGGSGERMQGWRQEPGAAAASDAAAGGGAHFQIDGWFEVSGVGTGKCRLAVERLGCVAAPAPPML